MNNSLEILFKPGNCFKILKPTNSTYSSYPNRVYCNSVWKIIIKGMHYYNDLLISNSLKEFFDKNTCNSHNIPSFEIIVGHILSKKEINSAVLILDTYLDENIFLLKTLTAERIIFWKVPIRAYEISKEEIINSVELI